MRINRKLLILISGLIFCVVVISILRMIFFNETLKSVATKVLSAINHKNPDIVFDYMVDEEKKMISADRNKFETFFQNFYLIRMNGFQPVGKPSEMVSESQQLLVLTQKYLHPDGRETELSVPAIVTDDGIKVVGISRSLFLTALATYARPDKPIPIGKEKPLFFANSIDEALPLLKNSGLNGFMYGFGEKSKFYTWEGFRDYMLDNAKRLNQ